jgi:hypothetical protein
MIKNADDFFVNQFFQITEIDHYPVSGTCRVVGGTSGNRYKQPVRMAVNISARTIIVPQRMGHLKRKYLRYPYNFCHFVFFKQSVQI